MYYIILLCGSSSLSKHCCEIMAGSP